MLKTLTTAGNLLGTALAFAVITGLGLAAWIGWDSYYGPKRDLAENRQKLVEQEGKIADLTRQVESGKNRLRQLGSELGLAEKENERLEGEVAKKQEEITALNRDLEAKRKEIERLETAVRLLKVDHRLARISVVRQQGSDETGDLTTTFRFVEVDQEGQTLEKPRVFTVEGDLIYIDAWVIKFTDALVELPDPVRSTSLCQFRRIFGEKQQPKEGFPLDTVGSRPAAYRGASEMSELEKRIWERFWEYANDPAKARKDGVRAAHGEAPSIKLVPGGQYKVLLRASDGLTIVSEEKPRGQGDPIL